MEAITKMVQRWEYLKLDRTLTLRHKNYSGSNAWVWSDEIPMNEMGDQGWELVTIVPSSTDGTTDNEMWLFKRPVEGSVIA